MRKATVEKYLTFFLIRFLLTPIERAFCKMLKVGYRQSCPRLSVEYLVVTVTDPFSWKTGQSFVGWQACSFIFFMLAIEE